MTTDSQALRLEADRLAEQAREAEQKAAREEKRRAQMEPKWRVADLLHTHLARSYPGAGGAMDGGDPWYYEIPNGQDAEARWINEWVMPGSEHQHFLRAAGAFTRAVVCGPGDVDPTDTAYEQAEKVLQVLVNAIGPSRTEVAHRIRRERSDQYRLDSARDKALEAITALHELAGRPRP